MFYSLVHGKGTQGSLIFCRLKGTHLLSSFIVEKLISYFLPSNSSLNRELPTNPICLAQKNISIREKDYLIFQICVFIMKK